MWGLSFQLSSFHPSLAKHRPCFLVLCYHDDVISLRKGSLVNNQYQSCASTQKLGAHYMRLQVINEIQEIDASKEKQRESDSCTSLNSPKAAPKSKATVFGWEKLRDKQEDVFISISANCTERHFPVSISNG